MRPLILCLLLAGCAKPLIKPEVVTVTQRVPVAVPSELTKPEPVPPLRSGTVYSREEQRLELLKLVDVLLWRMKMIRGLK